MEPQTPQKSSESQAPVQTPKVSRWSRSKQLIQSSWQVLKLDKELLTLPIIGFVVSFLAIVIGGVMLALTLPEQALGSQDQPSNLVSWAIFIVGILVLTFISNFIATAIAKGAIDRFQGHDPTVKSSLGAAKQRIKPIFLFSLLSVTVGLILSVIRDRVPFAGRILAFLGDLIWGVATFFVIPIIAMSEKPVGPIDATKQSAGIIKRVWGESLIVNAGIGLIAFLSIMLYLPVTIVISMIAAATYVPLGMGLAVLFVFGLVGLFLVFNVLSAIVKAAIYYWATTGQAPANFNQELLRASLTPKKAKKFFA